MRCESALFVGIVVIYVAHLACAKTPAASPSQSQTSPPPGYQLSFDIERGNQISRGRITVVVDPYQRSQLIVQTVDRVYQWEGKAGFMDGFDGPSQLHLRPVGSGCLTRSQQPCPVAVPPVVVDCSPASLQDRTPDTLVAGPVNTRPAQRDHLTCRVEVEGNWERELLPDEVRFLNRRLLYSRNGMPELILRYAQSGP